MFESFGGVDGGGPVRPPVPPEVAAEAARRLGEALELPPGVEAITALARVDADALDDYDAAELLVAWERSSRWVAAQQARAVVAVAGARPASRDDFPRERVRVALLGCGGSAKAHVDVARDLCGRLAQAGEALERGDLSYSAAMALTAETLLLDDATAAEVAAAVLDEAATRMSPAQFRRRVRAAVIATDPARAEQRARRAGRRRQASKTVEPDAQACLLLTGPALAVETIWTALNVHAATAPPCCPEPSTADGEQDPRRTLDQRRFDALADICSGFLADYYGVPAADPNPADCTDPADGADPARGANPDGAGPATAADAGTSGAADGPVATGATDRAAGDAGAGLGGAIGTDAGRSCDCAEVRLNRAARRAHARSSRRAGVRPHVFLFADAATWAGLADAPIQLDGYGPIPAGIARDHFETSQWRAVLTDTVDGQAVAVSDKTYTPSARTRRHLHVRDRTCGFPGCGAAVWFCDVDHNTPHADGGCTDTDNCGLFCRRHHRLKTFTPWTWAREPDGTITWTDPTGHQWQRDPVRYRMPRPAEPTTGTSRNETPAERKNTHAAHPPDAGPPDGRPPDPPPPDPDDDIPPF